MNARQLRIGRTLLAAWHNGQQTLDSIEEAEMWANDRMSSGILSSGRGMRVLADSNAGDFFLVLRTLGAIGPCSDLAGNCVFQTGTYIQSLDSS